MTQLRFLSLLLCCRVLGAEPPVMKLADLVAQAHAPAAEPVPDLPRKPGNSETLTETPRIVVPGLSGIIDTAPELDADTDPFPNPFRRRLERPAMFRDVPLLITATSSCARPLFSSAVINGRLYGAGDGIEGFAIASIAEDAVDFAGDKLVIRVPVDRPVALRLPR